MKKAFLFISTAFLLSSCAAVKSPVTGYVYQETQSPVSVTSNPLGSKKGEATATSVLGWFAFGEIRMRANLRKIVAYKDFAKQMVMAQYE